jgi:hypothetical protein
MSATLLSFTRTVDTDTIHRAMLAAMLPLAQERAEAAADPETHVELWRNLTTMAAAYADLAAQLGIVPPSSVETILNGCPTA